MNFRKTLTFLSAVIILFTAGCAVNEKHPQYKVGQIYKTTKDSFVVFEYAAFIWQNRRGCSGKRSSSASWRTADGRDPAS